MFASATQNRVLNIAHRGARSLAPENTLAAARKALELGADMWELDVAMTADGELIVIHDSTLARTSNATELFPGRQPWRVHEFKLEEIRRLDFGSWFIQQDPFQQIAAGLVTKAETAKYVGEPAPTLVEALAFTRDHGWRVNVEIKDLRGQPGHTQIVQKVMSFVGNLNMQNMVLISSFSLEYLAQIRKADPGVASAILASKPYPRPEVLLRRLRAQAYHLPITSTPLSHISLLKEQGICVNVYTVNDCKTMERMVDAGVSGIFTDFPQVLASVLADRDENDESLRKKEPF